MAAPSPTPCLFDIIQAIELIRSEMAEVTLAAFESDIRRRWLIERCVEIISEARRHLPAEMKARHPGIPWPKVAGIGNVLRHNFTRSAARSLRLKRIGMARETLPGLTRALRRERLDQSVKYLGPPATAPGETP
jgi:uncharacterized protein with HEPN domain